MCFEALERFACKLGLHSWKETGSHCVSPSPATFGMEFKLKHDFKCVYCGKTKTKVKTLSYAEFEREIHKLTYTDQAADLHLVHLQDDKKNKQSVCGACGKKLIFTDSFFCPSCGNVFCHKHNIHGLHYASDEELKFVKWGKCSACKKKMNVLDRSVCMQCGKVFCSEHRPNKKHKCVPRKWGRVGYPATVYPDGTKIIDLRRPGYVSDDAESMW